MISSDPIKRALSNQYAVYDIEVYPDFILAMFLMVENNSFIQTYYTTLHEISNAVVSLLKNRKLIGYNNRRYDHIIIDAILNKTVEDEYGCYQLSKNIISKNTDYLPCFNTNIIDLMELLVTDNINPTSLKEIGHRLKYPQLRNLPYDFNEILGDEHKKQHVIAYCKHDVYITSLLWCELKRIYDARISLKDFFVRNEMRIPWLMVRV